ETPQAKRMAARPFSCNQCSLIIRATNIAFVLSTLKFAVVKQFNPVTFCTVPSFPTKPSFFQIILAANSQERKHF
ncbi:MAG: hypothetical protein ACM37Z_15010, partial [Deltaproteobacteria bacterium]